MEALTTNISSLMETTKTVIGLFTEFPLNLFLAGSVAGIGFALFRKAKKSAR